MLTAETEKSYGGNRRMTSLGKQSQLPAAPGGSRPGGRGAWRAIVRNKANLALGVRKWAHRQARRPRPRADCAKRSQLPGGTRPQGRGTGANVQNEPNLRLAPWHGHLARESDIMGRMPMPLYRLAASLRAGFLLPGGRIGVSSASTAGWSDMEVKIESLLEGAKRASGTVVIVDVFRAFTTAAVALARGAERIVMVAEIDEALRLRNQGVGDVCVGEVNGIKPEGFDFGNSPHEMTQASLQGKVVIQSTRAGTTGAAAATQAKAVYAGAFVVAEATAEAIRRDNPPQVTIVAMGWNARVRTDEDELCALYLRNLLQGRRPDPGVVRKLVLASGEAAKFGDPKQPHFHREDLEIALEIDKYDFAIRVVKEDGFLVARRHG